MPACRDSIRRNGDGIGLKIGYGGALIEACFKGAAPTNPLESDSDLSRVRTSGVRSNCEGSLSPILVTIALSALLEDFEFAITKVMWLSCIDGLPCHELYGREK